MLKHSQWNIGHDKRISFTIEVFRKYEVLRGIIFFPIILLELPLITYINFSSQSVCRPHSVIHTHILRCPSP